MQASYASLMLCTWDQALLAVGILVFRCLSALFSSLFSVSLIVLRASFIVFLNVSYVCFIFLFGLEAAELGSA